MWPIAFAWFKRAGTYKNKIGYLMSYENIIFDLDGGIARITFNRPDKLNSFTAAMHGELADALTKVEAGGVRVLVLTGNGRGFCAGQDLSEREMSRSEEHTSELQSLMRISYAVFCLKKKNYNHQ